MNLQINLPEGVLQRFHQAKDFVNAKVNSVTESAQQVGESLHSKATQATDRTVDTVTTTFGQAKSSLEQSLQTAEQIKSTTTNAFVTAISSSVNDWFAQHPAIFRLLQILGWAVNHPIISAVMLIFALAMVWTMIKLIGRAFESASLSILQVPVKLFQALIKVSFSSFTKIGGLAFRQLTNSQKSDIIAILPSESQKINQEKQLRLAEISQRLEEIQQEQNLLLQEAADLLASKTIAPKMPELELDTEKHLDYISH